jgi:hypothetical protein
MNREGKGVAVMAYTITDIAELVEYHLVVSALDDDVVYSNLVQLVQQLEQLAPGPLWREATWVFCDRCGCSVDTDLIHPDGHHYAEDGDFYCADCWEDAS